jgi:signal peptidase I
MITSKKEKPRQTFKEWLREMGTVFAAFLVLNSFGIANFQVPTGSMENEIMAGDFLIVNKLLFGGTTPRTIPFSDIRIPHFKLPALRSVKRGDPIVFDFPGYRDEKTAQPFAYYLKRCLALAGDTLQIIDGKVYVNHTPAPVPRNAVWNHHKQLSASYADPSIFPPGTNFNDRFYGPIRIPKKGDIVHLSPQNFGEWYTFILREHNSIEIKNGALYINDIPSNIYTVKRDYLFAMGDNRDNSLDSRFWGFVPEEDVIGTPLFVIMSWDPNIAWSNLIDKLASVRPSRIGHIVQ